ncbi:MAG: hypothetical protein HY342_09490 [Candidatus Lambdaproteobacteria bacterium]|nr:hypothetical protein [Candidatus Lambdaproteobacteria bacterium]
MNDFVNYIEKTHAYYLRQGYKDAYQYARNEDTPPFVRPTKPLKACRLMLVSSAGIEIVPDDGPRPEPFRGRNIGPKGEASVFPIPSDIKAEKLVYVSGAHNRAECSMLDIDAFFPVTHLRALRDEGIVGSLAEHYLRIKPRYSQRETRELDAPEVLRRCREERVDVVLLAPI